MGDTLGSAGYLPLGVAPANIHLFSRKEPANPAVFISVVESRLYFGLDGGKFGNL